MSSLSTDTSLRGIVKAGDSSTRGLLQHNLHFIVDYKAYRELGKSKAEIDLVKISRIFVIEYRQ